MGTSAHLKAPVRAMASFGSEPWRRPAEPLSQRLRSIASSATDHLIKIQQLAPAIPEMEWLPTLPAIPAMGACSPASAATDVQTFGEDGSGTDAHDKTPDQEAPSDDAKDEVLAASPSKFAMASEAAKNAIASVDKEPSLGAKRGRRRGTATRTQHHAAGAQSADAAEKPESAWPTALSCTTARRPAGDSGQEHEAASMMQRLQCGGKRQAAASVTTEPVHGRPAGYMESLQAAASCSSAHAAAGHQNDAPASSAGFWSRVQESVPLCGANHAPPAADATAAGPAECSAPLQKADSPATEHGSTQATAVADEGKDDESSASRKSLLARLKEASSCSPATRLRVQVNASHKPKARVRATCATCACERDQGVRVHSMRVSVAVFACGEPRSLSTLGTDAGPL